MSFAAEPPAHTTIGVGQPADIEAVIKHLLQSPATVRVLSKTTTQYESRLSAAIKKRDLIFVLPHIPGVSELVFSYDADDESMDAQLYGVSPQKLWDEPGFPEKSLIVLSQRLISTDQYLGANAYGVRRTISRRRYVEYGLAFEPGPIKRLGQAANFSTPAFR